MQALECLQLAAACVATGGDEVCSCRTGGTNSDTAARGASSLLPGHGYVRLSELIVVIWDLTISVCELTVFL